MKDNSAEITPKNSKYDNKKRKKLISIIVLQVAVIIHALSGVFSKMASGHEFLTWEFILPYGLSLFCMLLFAVLWQYSLKRISLINAFLSKAMGTIWMALFGFILFKEAITIGRIIGLLLVIVGSFFVVFKDE